MIDRRLKLYDRIILYFMNRFLTMCIEKHIFQDGVSKWQHCKKTQQRRTDGCKSHFLLGRQLPPSFTDLEEIVLLQVRPRVRNSLLKVRPSNLFFRQMSWHHCFQTKKRCYSWFSWNGSVLIALGQIMQEYSEMV